jgi:hypothetical protein
VEIGGVAVTATSTLPILKIPGAVALISDDGCGSAIFSENMAYRYFLGRNWSPLQDPKWICYIGSNPSTANHKTDDMTIKKEIGFGKKLGFTGLLKVNLGALVSTDPAGLLAARDCMGPHNLFAIKAAVESASLVVVAWGGLNNRVWEKFGDSVKLVKSFKGLKCLGRTKTGAPHHTSRLEYAAKLEEWP